MRLFLLTCITFLCTENSLVFASDKLLIMEFMEKSLNIKIAELDHERNVLSRDASRAAFTWIGTAGAVYDNNQLDPAASGFNTNQLDTTSYSIGLTKGFEFGLTASLSNELVEQDRSRLAAFLQGDSQLLYEFGQTISITQDLGKNFFGNQFYLNLRGLNESVNFSQINLNQAKQTELSTFYRNLLTAIRNKSQVKIARDALDWSTRLLGITKRRVRDGLNEVADLYQAELNQKQAEENLESAKYNYKSARLALSESLRRELKDSEIREIVFGKVKLSKNVKFSLDENFDYKKVQASIRRLNLEKKSIKRDFYPSVSFAASYATNEFDGSQRVALEDGIFGNDTDNLSLSLDLNFPLTRSAEKVNLASKNAELMRAKYDKQRIEERLKYNSELLSKQMETRKSNLLISGQRLKIAEKNLNENNRLYRIGRIDIDRLLSAEESLLNTETSYLNNWFDYEIALSQKASLYGKLLQVLNRKF